MTETAQILTAILILIGVIYLTRKYHAWRTSKAYIFIVEDLKVKSAYTPESAITLPYAHKSLLRMGLRDYRPGAMDHLVLENIVGRTEDGRYYLKDRSL